MGLGKDAVSQEGVTNFIGLQVGLGSPSPYNFSAAVSTYTGTPVYAISATSFLMPAMVVNGSASTFTVLVWPAARPGDVVQVVPAGLSAAVSSLSSGLIAHSHCTLAGQVEIRLSNVSTLVQNQSSITWNIARWAFF